MENITETADLRFMIAGLYNTGSSVQKIADAGEVTTYFTGEKVDFNIDEIKVENGVITVGKVLDTDNWEKLKSDPSAKRTEPYRITVLANGSDKSKKAFKIAFYQDGTHAIEEVK